MCVRVGVGSRPTDRPTNLLDLIVPGDLDLPDVFSQVKSVVGAIGVVIQLHRFLAIGGLRWVLGLVPDLVELRFVVIHDLQPETKGWDGGLVPPWKKQRLILFS